MNLPWLNADRIMQLNYSDPDRLLGRHRHLLTVDQLTLLEINCKRIEQWPEKFGSEAYKIDSSLIAMSDVHKKQAICRCGIPNSRNRSGRCNQHRLCEACAEHRKQKSLERFQPFFNLRAWSHAVLSWEDYLFVDPGSTDDIQLYWEACSLALKSVWRDGLIDGAYWAEQIHLDSLWPQVWVNPHVHALVNSREADDLGDSLADALAERMASYVRPQSARIRLTPDVLLKPVVVPQHFHNCLQYLHHLPAVEHVYVRDWRKSGRVSGQRAAELNANLQEYYYVLAASTLGRQTVQYAGNMNAKRSDFLGGKKARKGCKKQSRKGAGHKPGSRASAKARAEAYARFLEREGGP